MSFLFFQSTRTITIKFEKHFLQIVCYKNIISKTVYNLIYNPLPWRSKPFSVLHTLTVTHKLTYNRLRQISMVQYKFFKHLTFELGLNLEVYLSRVLKFSTDQSHCSVYIKILYFNTFHFPMVSSKFWNSSKSRVPFLSTFYTKKNVIITIITQKVKMV